MTMLLAFVQALCVAQLSTIVIMTGAGLALDRLGFR